jgi:Zn-dependent oligopeptidase
MDKETENYFDESEMAKYFPVEHVLNVTFEIYQELLGLQIYQVDC